MLVHSPLFQNYLPGSICMGRGEGKTTENELVNPVSPVDLTTRKWFSDCPSEEVYQ